MFLKDQTVFITDIINTTSSVITVKVKCEKYGCKIRKKKIYDKM